MVPQDSKTLVNAKYKCEKKNYDKYEMKTQILKENVHAKIKLHDRT